ncbi:OLC1v1017711C1 [Oldenlandia corymbosa var. corymbosa]|uniref:OLC1v1017711C1 n=1 Tax=Oldenlandia corymbosa var. corymbosa TaxID=529605 RepID=A0AAV1EAC1_OLDCO|nr:OLC1v1017711C1 [Oldenlandia corymbosa var. corymbosa]
MYYYFQLSCVLGFLVTCAWKTLDFNWFQQGQLEKQLRSQGIPGNSYRPAIVDMREYTKMIKEGESNMSGIGRSSDNGDDIHPGIVSRFIFETAKKYAFSTIWVLFRLLCFLRCIKKMDKGNKQKEGNQGKEPVGSMGRQDSSRNNPPVNEEHQTVSKNPAEVHPGGSRIGSKLCPTSHRGDALSSSQKLPVSQSTGQSLIMGGTKAEAMGLQHSSSQRGNVKQETLYAARNVNSQPTTFTQTALSNFRKQQIKDSLAYISANHVERLFEEGELESYMETFQIYDTDRLTRNHRSYNVLLKILDVREGSRMANSNGLMAGASSVGSFSEVFLLTDTNMSLKENWELQVFGSSELTEPYTDF